MDTVPFLRHRAAVPDYVRQHLVSQVLLNQFTGSNGRLGAFDVATQQSRMTRPASAAFVRNFIAKDAEQHERMWQVIEGSLPEVLSRLDAGAPLSAVDEDTLRDLMALHWARSHTMRVVLERSIAATLAQVRAEGVGDDELRDVFRGRFGLEPVGPQALSIAAEVYAEQVEMALRSPDFQAARVVANFEEFRTKWATAPLEIAEAGEGEFLIGDNPVLTARAGSPTVGVLGGVTLSDADTAMMPVGRRFTVALGQGGRRTFDADAVAVMNRVQAAGAIQSVFFHPESGLDDWCRAEIEAGRLVIEVRE